MYDHVGLKVKDLNASVRFYESALAPLGHVVCARGVSHRDPSVRIAFRGAFVSNRPANFKQLRPNVCASRSR